MAPAEHSFETPPRLDAAPWLVRPETRAVFAALAAAGIEARAVGGAVRNALLGLAVADIDLATPAPPDAVLAAAVRAGLEAIPTGLAHGTVTILSGHIPYEVTTLRRDVATDGRHATIAFTDDWAADAGRRDFSMNALYCDAAGRVHDPLGGYGDLAARRVRFIGDAAARIAEDYLRILRFFRIHATYGTGDLDAAGLAACVAGRAGLRRLSAERIRAEIMKLLVAPGALGAIGAMREYGLLVDILGAAPRPARLEALAALEAALGRTPDAMLRLAALTVAVAEDAHRLAERLRLANDERAVLAWAGAETPVITPAMPDTTLRRAAYAAGRAAVITRLLLDWAGSGAAPDDPRRCAMLALAAQWPIPTLPVGGRDVLALGLAPGPAVGLILREVEQWWIDRDFPADAAAVRAELASIVARRAATGGA